MPGVVQGFGIGGSGSPPPMSMFGDPSTFTAAGNQQMSDYDKIMAQYANLASSYAQSPITAKPVAPIAAQTTPYTQSSDVTGSLSDLSNLATTGGYSDAGIADIRARDISPIRSIYSNAQQNIERQKALSGGYSPNFDAVTASMARDESNQIAGVNTTANAGIAQNVASNKIAAAPSYASAAASANAAQTAADQHNTDIINQINEANANIAEFNTNAQTNAAIANKQGQQGAIQGQTSLYGTTPALTNTFGNQVVQAAQLGQGQQQLNQNNQRNIYSLAMGGN